MSEESKVFKKLSNINLNDKTEKKGNLTYLSWAWAWAEAKKAFPSLERKVYEQENGVNYFSDGLTAWVKVGVTIEGLEHIDYLPIMDFKNKSMKVEFITSFDVNKAIQRSTTKAIALHGLGLYIYAGEDLPDTIPLSTTSVIDSLKNFTDLDGLNTYYKLNAKEFSKNAEYIAAFAKRKKELQ